MNASKIEAEFPPEAERQRAYEDTLIDRLQRGLPLSKSDKADARRLLRDRAAKAEGADPLPQFCSECGWPVNECHCDPRDDAAQMRIMEAADPDDSTLDDTCEECGQFSCICYDEDRDDEES